MYFRVIQLSNCQECPNYSTRVNKHNGRMKLEALCNEKSNRTKVVDDIVVMGFIEDFPYESSIPETCPLPRVHDMEFE